MFYDFSIAGCSFVLEKDMVSKCLKSLFIVTYLKPPKMFWIQIYEMAEIIMVIQSCIGYFLSAKPDNHS